MGIIHKQSSWHSIQLAAIILISFLLLYLQIPMVSKGAPDDQQTTLPPGITKIAFGTAFNNQTDCDISDPLPEPITYPANTSQLALQVVFSTLGTHSYQANITPDFGAATISNNCNKYTICQGQVCQTQFGVTIKRADAQPFSPNTYTFSFLLDNGSPVNIPFVIPNTTPPTATDTQTATPTHTATTTNTLTPTNTPTSTPTPTDTLSATPTTTPHVFLPMVKNDPSPTLIPTFTSTPTVTPTHTPTVTDRPTVTTIDGTWRGATSYAQHISFEIINSGIVSFTTSYRNGGCGATTSLYTIDGSSLARVIDNHFLLFYSAFDGMEISADGTFGAETQATGTISILNSRCGNFAGSWSVNKAVSKQSTAMSSWHEPAVKPELIQIEQPNQRN